LNIIKINKIKLFNVKKIIGILMVGIFILSGCSIIAISDDKDLLDEAHLIHLNIKTKPQYSPQLNIIPTIAKEIEKKIETKPPEEPLSATDGYNMVIIAPSRFSTTLQPLIEHKNNYGIITFLKTTEGIYNDYEGRDRPEKIKKFLKDTYENYKIKYALLIGDIDKIPMRYASVNLSDYNNIPTDLYYADLFFENGSFCDWDSNKNNKFGEYYSNTNYKDNIDLYPDICIGRLPCKNTYEVNLIVSKIIEYETSINNNNWFKTILFMGGDTHPGDPGYEGEITNEYIEQHMKKFDFDITILSTSENTFHPLNINRELSKGYGFVCYSGHGFPHGLGTYPPNDFNMINYHQIYIHGIHNGNMLPIIFLDACLTGNMDKKIFGIHFPCFAWSLVKKSNGGGIATIGATRSVIGTVTTDEGPLRGSCLFNLHFFEEYKPNTYISEMFSQAQIRYLNTTNKRDPFTIELFQLIGDPSLKVGGYYEK